MSLSGQRIDDYTLYDQTGPVKLSSLFGGRERLVILHNMGKHCPNCALWGDEFNGMLPHLERVTAFCVVSPDAPATQAAYVKERGWASRIYSAQGTSFIGDMGFEGDDGKAQPGISILRQQEGALSVVKQVNVTRDKHCPSVLEVFWMLPGVKTSEIAWPR